MKSKILFLLCLFSAQIFAQSYGEHTETFVAGESITAPAFVYISSSNGKVYKANATTTANPAVGLILTTVLVDSNAQLITSGVVDWPTTLTPGLNYYLSATTSGDVTTTAPTNVQFVGRAVSTTRMQILPSKFLQNINDLLPTQTGNSGKYLTTDGSNASWATVSAGSGTVTSVSVASANGFAGSVATATSTPAITISTSVSGIAKGNGTALSAATAGTDYSAGTSALATGILKSTTGTGALSIATGADLPTMTATVGGAVPTPPNNTTTFLRGDGTFAAPSAGSGDITNGGNTTGAAVTIGTNDANGLNLETNNVTRLAITGGASTGGALTVTNVTANTSSIQDVITVQTNSTGAGAAGLGPGISLQSESSTTDNQEAARIEAPWTTATHATRTADIIFKNTVSGAAASEHLRIVGASTPVLKIGGGSTTYGNGGITTGVSFTLGNSSSTLNIGSGSGSVVINNTGASNIQIQNIQNTATSTAGIVVGNATSFTQTSGTRNYIDCNWSFAPTSGTAVHNQLSFTGTLNQTGGANGIVRGINLAHTVTAVADYRALEIADNGSNVKGIYQTGSTAVNNFVGKTGFGATTAPTALITLAAGTATANTAPLKFTSGTNLTAVENGAVEYDGTDYYVSSGGVRYTLAKVLKGSATLDFASTAAGAKSDLTITVTGAAAGDVVALGVDGATASAANGSFTAWVSAADTVTVRFTNNDLTNPINPASATYKVTVTK